MAFWIGMLVFTLFCYSVCLHTHDLKNRKKITFAYGAVLIFFAGMRSGIGDTGFYLSWFNNYKDVSISSLFGMDIKEVGFAFFMALVGRITQNPQVYLTIVALLSMGCIFYAINKYSEDIGMSLFLFMTSGIYLSMMNGIRQYIVVAGLFLLTNCLIKNKPILYICAALLLSTVHTSALFMIPIFFIARRKVWKGSTMLMILVISVSLLNIDSILPWVTRLLEDTVYSNYTESLLNDTDAGANALRVTVMVIPVLISFIGRKFFSEDDMEYRVYSNIMLLNAICYLFAAKNWIFARLAMYLHIYILLFYPYVIPKIFNQKSTRIIKMLLIISYVIFFIFEVRNTPYMSYYLNYNSDLIGEFTQNIYG